MKIILPLTVILVLTYSFAFANSPDSVRKEKKQRNSRSTLTIRTHNVGYFSFTGRIISTNPALDFFYTYDRKQWGFSAFKAFDLYDHNSSNNFMLLMLRKNFKLTDRLSITPHIGTILEQSNSIADKGSDISSIIITSYRASSHLIIDHTMIFGNLVFEPSERDWFNRVRFMYSKNHWDITYLVWHNNKLIDHNNSEYFSTGLNVFYSRIKVSEHFGLSAGISGLNMMCTNDRADYPKRNGIFFTLAGTIH
ncbi:MAG: hypothetical protein QM734_03605 [Cyclobacteriaceae bacterium]